MRNDGFSNNNTPLRVQGSTTGFMKGTSNKNISLGGCKISSDVRTQSILGGAQLQGAWPLPAHPINAAIID